MDTALVTPIVRTFLGLRPRQWIAAFLLAISYLLLMWLSEHLIPHPSSFFPSSALALSVLFLEGIELWPIVYCIALIGSYFAGYPLVFLFIIPIAQTLQAILGAYLLQKGKVDPLFRRSRYIFILIVTVFVVGLIVPSLTSLAAFIEAKYFAVAYYMPKWNIRYIGNVLSLLVITPFMLRWFAKPRFSRTFIEGIETTFVFVLLVVIDYFLFLKATQSIAGIPLVYFLLIPLFWIALRLRPRFVTLAILITSIFGIASIIYLGPSNPALFTADVFQTEEFLIILAMTFFIIVSLEEDRRMNSNLLRAQVASLENANARISSESSAKNDFIAVLAHELRNPLAPVVSAIDVMRLQKNLPQQEIETLEMMNSMMQTVRRILDDLLDISRIAEGKIGFKKELVDLKVVIERSILSTVHYRKERHQSLTFIQPEQQLCITGDAVRIEQIFSNLLANASKYSDPGDTITISLKRAVDDAAVTVSDEGVGIDPAALADIFLPFHQVGEEARSKKGLGIGLALVKSFAEMHGGTVYATSKGLGQGSEFTVLLPLTSVKRNPTPKGEDSSMSHAELDTVMPHILVVDDNDEAAWGIGRLLEMRGCTVTYAYDARQAIETASSIRPDIILLDLALPDVDGYAAAKTMRARGFRGKLIALTGYSGEEIREKGREAGFEAYLVKPASLEELKRAIPEIA
jgi:signal transduction histidine kinase/CheY-like chemotaxis protein